MAFLGHRTPDEARTYVKHASRAKLGDSAKQKLQNGSKPRSEIEQIRSQHIERNKQQ